MISSIIGIILLSLNCGVLLNNNQLRPQSQISYGFYEGPSGLESYYYANPYYIEKIVESLGYDYEYHVRGDGVQMVGDYCIVASNIDQYPYGTVLETSLGLGMVLDCGQFGGHILNYESEYTLDIGTVWY